MRFRAALYALLGIVAAIFPGETTDRKEGPFRDVFFLMEEVDRRSEPGLWPGFFPRQIPAAVFDGRETYLFGFGRLPAGFAPVPGRADVSVFPGRHEIVLGNRRAEFDGTWIATAIPGYGPVANHRSKTLADVAAIILHEKFHVFQILRHPDWRPNDLVLLTYPLDQARALADRRLELEAFKRALSSAASEDAAAWVRTGLELRNLRHSTLTSAQTQYEREIQWLEGLAQYIEYRSAGRTDTEDAFEDDLAPRGVRHQGYFEGSWAALLLDRFDPAWKERLESGESAALEDLLAAALPDGATAEFTPEDLSAAQAAAEADVAARRAARRKEERNFFAKLGYRVELRSPEGFLRFEMFDPFSFESLSEKQVLHPLWITCRTTSGFVRTLGRPCLTEVDERGRIVRITLTGIHSRPAVAEGWNVPLRWVAEGVRMEIGKARVRFLGSRVVIDVGE